MERHQVIRAAFELRASDDEARKHTFVISSRAVDSYGTSLNPKGWKLDRYIQNPVVAYNHMTGWNNPDYIIGTSRVWMEGEQLLGEVMYEPEDINPLAEKIRKKVGHGTLRMASVGFQVMEYHWGREKDGEDPDVVYFDEMELFEWSIVDIGANPEALMKNTAKDLRELFPREEREEEKQTPKLGFDTYAARHRLITQKPLTNGN